MVNVDVDTVIYAGYSKDDNSHVVSFTEQKEFWDYTFLNNLMKNSNGKNPVLRAIEMPKFLSSAEHVFTYYYRIRSKSDSCDGVIVVNINADRLLDLCYGTAGSTERQIIVAENSKNYYSSATVLLDENSQEKLFAVIENGDIAGGQYIVDADHGQIFCTWIRGEESPFLFISCVPVESIKAQLKPLKFWLAVFYCSTLFITIISIIWLMRTMREKYASLQKLYDKEVRRYQDNHSYVNDTLLRNFLTSKEDYDAVTARFQENSIELESYAHYSLLLLEARSLGNGFSGDRISLRIALQGALAAAAVQKYRYEIADVFQNRWLLIMENANEEEIQALVHKVNELFEQKCGHRIFCLYSMEVSSLNEIPMEYQFLAQQTGLLYFYPEVTCMNASSLQYRKFTGYNLAESVGKQILAELKAKNFDTVKTLLVSFFDSWFEPGSSQERTLDHLIRIMAEYLKTMVVSCAVSMDFDENTFRNKVYRCDYAENVKELFLNLVEDIRVAVSSNGHRNRYVDSVLEIIHTDYADGNLSPELIADRIGLSASHMQSVFRAETGTSVSRYLRQYRLEKAAQLLADTEIPVNTISEQTGFGNQNYFFTLFKKHYGVTPSEYRTATKEE